MNALSWTLYLAEVSDSVKGFSSGLFWLILLLMVVFLLATGITQSFVLDLEVGSDERKSAERLRNGTLSYALKVFLPIWIVMFMVAAFIPSRNTLMLIAASQFGELALTSEAAQQIGGETGELAVDSLKLLHQYVQNQLSPPPVVPTPATK